MTRRVAAAAAALLLTAGCSSPTPPQATTYGSLDGLRSAVVGAGVPCDRWQADPASWAESFGVKDGTTTGQCNDGKTGVYLTWYRDLTFQDQAKSRQTGAEDDSVLWGPDWSIRADPGTVKQIQREIGGVTLGS